MKEGYAEKKVMKEDYDGRKRGRTVMKEARGREETKGWKEGKRKEGGKMAR